MSCGPGLTATPAWPTFCASSRTCSCCARGTSSRLVSGAQRRGGRGDCPPTRDAHPPCLTLPPMLPQGTLQLCCCRPALHPPYPAAGSAWQRPPARKSHRRPPAPSPQVRARAWVGALRACSCAPHCLFESFTDPHTHSGPDPSPMPDPSPAPTSPPAAFPAHQVGGHCPLAGQRLARIPGAPLAKLVLGSLPTAQPGEA